MFKVRVYSLCVIGTVDSLCAKAELRDLKPKLCGSGTAERQVAVYFLYTVVTLVKRCTTEIVRSVDSVR